MYEARISRNHPAAFLILIDQSGSMSEPTTFHGRRMSKSEAVALTVNMLIDELLNRCKREEGYRDYFDIATRLSRRPGGFALGRSGADVHASERAGGSRALPRGRSAGTYAARRQDRRFGHKSENLGQAFGVG